MKKIKNYLIVAIWTFVFGNVSNAQIIYTDVVPDKTVSASIVGNSANYNLDLNNDGVTDFYLMQIKTDSSNAVDIGCAKTAGTDDSSITISTTGGGGMGGQNYVVFKSDTSIEWEYPLFLRFQPVALEWGNIIGDTIIPPLGDGSPWISVISFGIPLNYNGTSGRWIDVEDKYLGFGFVKNNKSYYGWARLDVAADGTNFTIKDYAYEKTPDKQIMIGDNGTGIKENSLSEAISIYSYNKTLFVDFKDNKINGGVIKLYNTIGQEVKSVAVNNTKMEINVDDVELGVYFIKVFVNDRFYTEKIIVQ